MNALTVSALSLRWTNAEASRLRGRMNVLGIDPGMRKCGIALVDLSGRRPRVIEVRTIRTDAARSVAERFAAVGSAALEVARAGAAPPTLLAIEDQSLVQNAKRAAGKTNFAATYARDVACYLRGRIPEAIPTSLIVVQPSPQRARSALGLPRGADKARVKAAVERLCDGTPARWSYDAADAVAVAIAGAREAR